MLLSLPTWAIHLFSVSEWFVAMLLFWRYGRLIGRHELQLFAYCMTPHLLGGLTILWFHVGGDSQPLLLDRARSLTFLGSLLLSTCTLGMLLRHRSYGRLIWLLLPLGLAWALTQWVTAPVPGKALLRGANLFYLVFLIALLILHRRDRALFSSWSVGGFWFLLVFVAVTIYATWVATHERGLPSLSHDDLLHGLSESFMSLSNLMVAAGAYLQLKRASGRQASARPGIGREAGVGQ